MISRLEVRDEQSVDVVGHLNTREERMVMVPPGDDADYLAARDAVAGLYGSLLRRLLGMGVTHYGMDQDPTKVAQYTLVQLNQSLMQTPPNGMQQHMVHDGTRLGRRAPHTRARSPTALTSRSSLYRSTGRWRPARSRSPSLTATASSPPTAAAPAWRTSTTS